MKFVCDVYNKAAAYTDSYMVVAVDRKAARTEMLRRLDEETDEGSKGFDIIRIVPVNE